MCKDKSIYSPLKVTIFEHKTSVSTDLFIVIVIDLKVDQVCGKGTLHIYLCDSEIAEKNKTFNRLKSTKLF